MLRADSRLSRIALGLVVGGALGNVIDRLRFGAVVDFLYVHVSRFDWWPVFQRCRFSHLHRSRFVSIRVFVWETRVA